jgi:hypothetical protein
MYYLCLLDSEIFSWVYKMYYKDSPYGQASYPQQAGAYYESAKHQTLPTQNVRAPLLPHGYDGGDMMYGDVMDTVKGYFSNPWAIVIGVILIVIIIAWLMSDKKEGYRHY